MGAADGGDLAGVVASMGEVEAAPLRRGERSEGEVRETAHGAEGLFGLIEYLVKTGEGIVCGGDEFISRTWSDGCGGGDLGRGLASARHDAQRDDDELCSALRWSGARERRRAFGESGFKGGSSGGVGQEEMFNDLLDGPAGGIGGKAELSLRGVETVEC